MLVGGAVAERAARLVDPAEAVTLAGPPPRFVGRGGEKLDAALRHFGLDVGGRRALDAGASTGGFTDCLLQRGADIVVAVDVGHGQLHERLRRDPRVISRERTNVRAAPLGELGGLPFDVVVADLSFISLRTVAATLAGWTRPGGDLVVLVKPQFEAGRRQAARGQGGHPRPGRVAIGTGRRDCRFPRGRNDHDGPHGLATPRGRRQRGVPRPFPCRAVFAARSRCGDSHRGRRRSAASGGAAPAGSGEAEA